MDSNKIAIVALLFIVLIVAINLAMYGIARGASKGGDSRWLSALKDSLSKPMDSSTNKSIDELRKQVEELKKKENGE
jgi:hypothetical protein